MSWLKELFSKKFAAISIGVILCMSGIVFELLPIGIVGIVFMAVGFYIFLK